MTEYKHWLPQTLTAQGCFDHVVQHLHAQGGPAVRPDGDCQYLTPDGRRCAAGACFTEAGIARASQQENTLVAHLLGVEAHPHIALLEKLQNVHDHSGSRGALARSLRALARDCGLSTIELDARMSDEWCDAGGWDTIFSPNSRYKETEE